MVDSHPPGVISQVTPTMRAIRMDHQLTSETSKDFSSQPQKPQWQKQNDNRIISCIFIFIILCPYYADTNKLYPRK